MDSSNKSRSTKIHKKLIFILFSSINIVPEFLAQEYCYFKRLIFSEIERERKKKTNKCPHTLFVYNITYNPYYYTHIPICHWMRKPYYILFCVAIIFLGFTDVYFVNFDKLANIATFLKQRTGLYYEGRPGFSPDPKWKR